MKSMFLKNEIRIKFKSLTLISFWIFGVFPYLSNAQNADSTEAVTEKKFHVGGYLKNMETISFQNLNQVFLDNLVHNRLNFKFQASDKVVAVLEMRNRLMFGNQVNSTPNYGDVIEKDNGFLDMNWSVLNKPGMVFNTTIDRLYLDFLGKKKELRIGRQRINWGITMAWNPNDWFNTYNYFDFDYEERPGSDAIRARMYFKDGMSSLDVAANVNSAHQNVTAAMYKFNKSGYDFQILAGKYFKDLALGTGWAGNIGGAGFKGELSYFYPINDQFSKKAFVGTSSLDYSFKNSLYLSGAWLYSSLGINQKLDLGDSGIGLNAFGTLTAKSLFPSKNTSMLVGSYPVSPLLNISLAGIYGYGINLAFISPSISYSLKENVDLYLIGQSFFLQQQDKLKNLSNGAYFRIKWSF
ncbi:hypothetical protein EGI22_23495 [Lacihabitans sp. LS3-19]|nr:hypothetical protein [Lacihabitans sp. LS3-19]